MGPNTLNIDHEASTKESLLTEPLLVLDCLCTCVQENKPDERSVPEGGRGGETFKPEASPAEEPFHTRKSTISSEGEQGLPLKTRFLPVIVPSVALSASHRAELDLDSAKEQMFNDEARRRSESEHSGTEDSTAHLPTAGQDKPTVKSEVPGSEEPIDPLDSRGRQPGSRAEQDTSAEPTVGKSGLLERDESSLGIEETPETAAGEEQMGGQPAIRLSVPAAGEAERKVDDSEKVQNVLAKNESVSSDLREERRMAVAPGEGRADAAEEGRETAESGTDTYEFEEAVEGAESLRSVSSGGSSAAEPEPAEPEQTREVDADGGAQTERAAEESKRTVVSEAQSGMETPAMVHGMAGTETGGGRKTPEPSAGGESDGLLCR